MTRPAYRIRRPARSPRHDRTFPRKRFAQLRGACRGNVVDRVGSCSSSRLGGPVRSAANEDDRPHDNDVQIFRSADHALSRQSRLQRDQQAIARSLPAGGCSLARPFYRDSPSSRRCPPVSAYLPSWALQYVPCDRFSSAEKTSPLKKASNKDEMNTPADA
jgi:hypothetical protein